MKWNEDDTFFFLWLAVAVFLTIAVTVLLTAD